MTISTVGDKVRLMYVSLIHDRKHTTHDLNFEFNICFLKQSRVSVLHGLFMLCNHAAVVINVTFVENHHGFTAYFLYVKSFLFQVLFLLILARLCRKFFM